MSVNPKVINEILKSAKNVILEEIAKGRRFKDGLDFEGFAYESIKSIANSLEIADSDIIHQGTQTFPDITINNIGIEIKLSMRDSWNTVGNSIAEGTKVKGLSRIFIFFLKLGGTPDIRYGAYQEYLSDVVVTHSPRYLIDMTLAPDNTILAKIGVKYENIGEEAIPKLREYYMRQGKQAWWISPTDQENRPSKAYARFYKDLNENEKTEFIVDILTLFPEIYVPKSPSKFKRAAVYLLENYDCLNSSLRDVFSAGGKVRIIKHEFPRIFESVYKYAKEINNRLIKLSLKDREYYLGLSGVGNKSIVQRWIQIVIEKSGEKRVRELFNAGLTNG